MLVAGEEAYRDIYVACPCYRDMNVAVRSPIHPHEHKNFARREKR